MAELERHRAVCQVEVDSTGDADYVTLYHVIEDEEGQETTDEVAYLSTEDWTDMGEPDEVTVTFEPGNLLEDVDAP
jgi:hypothetical protein